LGDFVVRVGAPRSLCIAFGGRIDRAGSPRSLRIAFGGRIVRIGLEHFFGPHRPALSLSSHRVRSSHIRVGSPRSLRIAFEGRIVRNRSYSPRRLAALSSHRGRIVRVGVPRPSQQGNMRTQNVLLNARNMCTATCAHAPLASRFEVA
jgi:hypothetical protein